MYDYHSAVKIIIETDEEFKDWKKTKDPSWFFSQAAKKLNNFEDLYYKEKKYKDAKHAIEELGAFIFVVANLVEETKEKKNRKKRDIKNKS